MRPLDKSQDCWSANFALFMINLHHSKISVIGGRSEVFEKFGTYQSVPFFGCSFLAKEITRVGLKSD